MNYRTRAAIPPVPATTMGDTLQQRLNRVIEAQCGTHVEDVSVRAHTPPVFKAQASTKGTERPNPEAHQTETGTPAPLVEAQPPATPPATPPSARIRPRRPGRPRGYDHAVLAWLAAVRMAAARTTVRRFWTLAGKDASYGFAVLARLKKDGLLDSVPLMPGRGRSGMSALMLTSAGWRAVGKKQPASWSAPLLSLDHSRAWCALADCITERQAAGWELVHGIDAFEAIRKCAADRYRGHSLTGTESVMRDRVKRAPAVELATPSFTQSGTSAAWLVVHVMPGRNLRAWLDRLPDLRIFAPLQLEVVRGNPCDDDVIQRDIGRWAKRRKIKVEMRWAVPFTAHQNPILAPATGQDLFRLNLGKGVLALSR